MREPVTEMSHVDFVTLLPLGIFTDDEIVARINAYGRRIGVGENAELFYALIQLKGEPITGPIRTALRALDGLPPIDGD